MSVCCGLEDVVLEVKWVERNVLRLQIGFTCPVSINCTMPALVGAKMEFGVA